MALIKQRPNSEAVQVGARAVTTQRPAVRTNATATAAPTKKVSVNQFVSGRPTTPAMQLRNIGNMGSGLVTHETALHYLNRLLGK